MQPRTSKQDLSMNGKSKHDRMVNSILITGIAISCFYWVCESFMFFFLAPEANFIQHFWGEHVQHLDAAAGAVLFAIFGSHIQYTIDKEREADAALRESEAKYRTILESIEEGYFETDLLGNLTFSNGPLRRMLGYGPDELMQMNTQDFTTPKPPPPPKASSIGCSRPGPPPPFRTTRSSKGRTRKHLELSISLMNDPAGGRPGFGSRPGCDRAPAGRGREKKAGGPAAGRPENGSHRDACRRHRARFQQHPDGIQGNASLLEMRLEAGTRAAKKSRTSRNTWTAAPSCRGSSWASPAAGSTTSRPAPSTRSSRRPRRCSPAPRRGPGPPPARRGRLGGGGRPRPDRAGFAQPLHQRVQAMPDGGTSF